MVPANQVCSQELADLSAELRVQLDRIERKVEKILFSNVPPTWSPSPGFATVELEKVPPPSKPTAFLEDEQQPPLPPEPALDIEEPKPCGRSAQIATFEPGRRQSMKQVPTGTTDASNSALEPVQRPPMERTDVSGAAAEPLGQPSMKSTTHCASVTTDLVERIRRARERGASGTDDLDAAATPTRSNSKEQVAVCAGAPDATAEGQQNVLRCDSQTNAFTGSIATATFDPALMSTRCRPANSARSGSISRSAHSQSGSFSPRASNLSARLSFTLQRSITDELRETLGKDVRFSTFQRRNAHMDRVWHFLADPQTGPGAQIFDVLRNPLIIGSVAVPLLQQGSSPPLTGVSANAVEVGLESCFCIEILVRFVVCPDRGTFMKSVYNMVDIFTALPLVLRLLLLTLPDVFDGENVVVHTFLFGFIPVLRMLKLLRRFETFHLVERAFVESCEALPMLLYLLVIIALIFASLVYAVEPRDNIGTLPEAIWLTLVTMMTVGYGDTYPITTAGHSVTGVLMVCSCLYMALPIGIVGSAFQQVWEDRRRLLVIMRTRNRLKQWGYRATDIPHLFSLFDTSSTGTLDYQEFGRMLSLMRVGLREHLVRELFQAFDADGSGSVDEKEFVEQIFPQEYYLMYGRDELSQQVDID